MHQEAETLISKLGLIPHPEGGFYRELHRSPIAVIPKDGRGERSALTSIFFLLLGGESSAMHLVKSDEVWHHLEGAPMELITCDEHFTNAETNSIGPIREDMNPEYVVPANVWQAARSLGEWTLVNCVVAPGFDFEDIQMLRSMPKNARLFQDCFPDFESLV